MPEATHRSRRVVNCDTLFPNSPLSGHQKKKSRSSQKPHAPSPNECCSRERFFSRPQLLRWHPTASIHPNDCCSAPREECGRSRRPRTGSPSRRHWYSDSTIHSQSTTELHKTTSHAVLSQGKQVTIQQTGTIFLAEHCPVSGAVNSFRIFRLT